jgi:hypothetical protein
MDTNFDKKDILKEFQIIPGIGKSMAQDLWDLGLRSLLDLKSQNPERMYDQLCFLRGMRLDPCVLYVFRCATYFVTHKDHDVELLKWWSWLHIKQDPALPNEQLLAELHK